MNSQSMIAKHMLPKNRDVIIDIVIVIQLMSSSRIGERGVLLLPSTRSIKMKTLHAKHMYSIAFKDILSIFMILVKLNFKLDFGICTYPTLDGYPHFPLLSTFSGLISLLCVLITQLAESF